VQEMAAVITEIRMIYDSLGDAEKHVAGFILKNKRQVPFQSIHSLANASEVSVASVSRLTKRLGYAGYKEFKIKLAEDMASPVSAVYAEITPKDSDKEISEKIFGGSIKSLEETQKILNVSDLGKASQSISRCERLVFIGGGSSGYIAQDAALRFSHLGIEASVCTEPVELLVRSRKFDKNSVVFGISHSGRSAMTVKGLDLAVQSDAVTIGISNYSVSPLKDVSKFFFCTYFHENKVRAVAISSRISQIYVIDVLYALVARHLKTLPDEKTLNSLIEENYRLP
jgi:RpiR family transcriptional regulator, carbohydrate utilization regulator